MNVIQHYRELFEEVRLALKEHSELEFNFENFDMVCELMLKEIVEGNDDITAVEVLDAKRMDDINKRCA